MSMRDRIAAWLGIDQLEQSIARVNDKVQAREGIREEVRAVLVQLLERASRQSETTMHVWYDGSVRDVMALGNAIDCLTSDTARRTAEHVLKNRIDNEQFLDDVVERIMRKQLLVRGQ